MNLESTFSNSSNTSESSEDYPVDDSSSEEENIDSYSDLEEESNQDTVESDQHSEESDLKKSEENVGNHGSIEELKYKPAEQINYRVTPEEGDDERDTNHDDDRKKNAGYGLRLLQRGDFSMAPLLGAISNSEEPSMTGTLKYADEDFCLEAITEAIKKLIENET